MIRFAALCGLVLAVAGCSTAPTTDVPARRAPLPDTLPPMKTFAPREVSVPARPNSALARDFMELSFQMESGRELPRFTRFEGPITIRATGNLPSSLVPDLDRLISRLRSEAGINISRVSGASDANITVEAISRKQLQRVVPQAACFVVPHATGWKDFKSKRRGRKLDWAALEVRERVAIFLPSDVSPQEVRDCLHEEIAQALGPLNDLYRLPGSVFNDDNFHTVLTDFDMIMLRATYSPQLRSGMSRQDVAQRIPAVMASVNPRGGPAGLAPPIDTPRAWIDAIEDALGPGKSIQRRRSSAEAALRIALNEGWTDNRMAFSLFVNARLALGSDGDIALASFFKAGELYSLNPETQLQSAHVGMQLAAYALSSGDASTSLRIIDAHLPTVSQSQNAALLATYLMLKAEALDYLNRPQEAKAVRHDCLGWARYGFGSDAEVRARLAEIAELTPPKPQTGQL
ncbi:MAG: DUF2927 domain-containing protein [Pseudomonadota bacterium]